MKRTSLLAIAAAAATAFGASAQAADLGGDCCADLEERIAELEATTARKGNRKVSLTVSGWVNESVLFWDDGIETNTYQVTNMVAQSRFRMLGSAKINDDWSAGYVIEIGVFGSQSSGVNADTDDSSPSNNLNLRNSAWYLQSKRLGKVTVGQFSNATDGLLDAHVGTGLGAFMNENGQAMVGNFNLRTAAGGNGPTLRAMMGGPPGAGAQIGEGDRHNVVRYDSPALMGFTVSASWGEDDMWDVALRYAGEFNGIKVVANVGYLDWRDRNGGTSEYNCRGPVAPATDPDNDCSQFGVFAGILHAPTGFFLEGGYGVRWDNNTPAIQDDSSTQWFLIGGIERKFFPLGKTTIFGEYQQWDVATAQVFDGDLTAWGLGISQDIDAAAMNLYLHYRNYDGNTTNAAGVEADFESFHQLMAGARINF